ncbi:MAG: response regulator [Chitinivibrionales bacterium]|nr:response regulator [Chitinivibrionales bacterium]
MEYSDVDRKDIRLLVVDDEPEMLSFIADFLADMQGYTVHVAESGPDALENILPYHPIDMIISDINMPEMKGFELLKIVKHRYPAVKRLLITAYNIEDYLELALKQDVGNIFVKTVPFNFDELSVVIQNLLNNDVFGIEKHFKSCAQSRRFRITSGKQLQADAHRAVEFLPHTHQAQKLELVIFEILTNAVFYGIRKEKPDCKEEWNYRFELKDEEAIDLNVFFDPEKVAVSIIDNGGRLKKSDVLYWLSRQLTLDDDNVPIGLFDTHGRGFFIARRYIDRVIINIERDKRTEIILIHYISQEYKGFKPLYINEI